MWKRGDADRKAVVFRAFVGEVDIFLTFQFEMKLFKELK